MRDKKREVERRTRNTRTALLGRLAHVINSSQPPQRAPALLCRQQSCARARSQRCTLQVERVNITLLNEEEQKSTELFIRTYTRVKCPLLELSSSGGSM